MAVVKGSDAIFRARGVGDLLCTRIYDHLRRGLKARLLRLAAFGGGLATTELLYHWAVTKKLASHFSSAPPLSPVH